MSLAIVLSADNGPNAPDGLLDTLPDLATHQLGQAYLGQEDQGPSEALEILPEKTLDARDLLGVGRDEAEEDLEELVHELWHGVCPGQADELVHLNIDSLSGRLAWGHVA